MSPRHLHSILRIDRPIDEVFAFFERPANLDRITPPWMGMRILGDVGEMREGLEIDYAITPFPHVPAGWRSRTTAYDPPNSFTEVQLRGPYARWEHRHTFRADGDATIVEDDVTYERCRSGGWATWGSRCSSAPGSGPSSTTAPRPSADCFRAARPCGRMP